MRAIGLLAFAFASAFLGCGAGPRAPAAASPPSSPSEPGEPAPEKSAPTAHAPLATRLDGGCEGAKEAYIKECTERPEACPAHDGSMDVSAGAYGAVLNKGTYLNACGVPSSMAVTICAAVRDGRAVGITVTTTPGDEAIGGCVARAVQALSFPSSPLLDITRTTFAVQ